MSENGIIHAAVCPNLSPAVLLHAPRHRLRVVALSNATSEVLGFFGNAYYCFLDLFLTLASKPQSLRSSRNSS